MSAGRKQQLPCPRCSFPLAMPQPAPLQLHCPKCGATINRKVDASVRVTPTLPSALPVAPNTSGLPSTSKFAASRKTLLVCGTVALVLLVGGLFWLVSAFSGQKDSPGTDNPSAEPVAVKPDPNPPVAPVAPPPPDPRSERVQHAVDRGVAFLKAKAPGLAKMRPGYAGLNGLALLECDVPPDDPTILRLAEIIRATAHREYRTYDLAASLFFLNRWDESRPLDDKDRKMARSFALRIIAGQLPTGIWSYGGVLLTAEQETALLAALKNGAYRPNGRVQGSGVSMSNTQFALLAVWGSQRYGVPVRDPLLALAAYFHANQHDDGHWHYPGNSLAATSTCAGLLALAIERVLLEGQAFASTNRKLGKPAQAEKTADVNKAFAFVARTIGRAKGDPGGGTTLRYGGALFDADAMGDLYFLWTLERVGVIYSKELIDGKNWYDWGCPIVLKAQLADGSWIERHRLCFGPLIDTPFALLFLKRANAAKDLTAQVQQLHTSRSEK